MQRVPQRWKRISAGVLGDEEEGARVAGEFFLKEVRTAHHFLICTK